MPSSPKQLLAQRVVEARSYRQPSSQPNGHFGPGVSEGLCRHQRKRRSCLQRQRSSPSQRLVLNRMAPAASRQANVGAASRPRGRSELSREQVDDAASGGR